MHHAEQLRHGARKRCSGLDPNFTCMSHASGLPSPTARAVSVFVQLGLAQPPSHRRMHFERNRSDTAAGMTRSFFDS